MRETSLATMVLERAERYGLKRVLLSKQNGRWGEISWQTLGSKITCAAQGLAALGFRAGDRLAILAPIRKNNRGISGVERLRTPVTGILTPIRKIFEASTVLTTI